MHRKNCIIGIVAYFKRGFMFYKLADSVRLIVFALAAALPVCAFAQPDGWFKTKVADYPDLVFPAVATEWGAPSPTGNNIFKPAGPGPFPAVVVAHTCGGIEPHIYERAREILDAGYIVLVLDSYTSRKHFTFCTAAGVNATRFYKDTFDALAHLKGLADVDPAKVYLVGFSLGSFAAAVASSPEVVSLLQAKHRFTASVGWYGSCVFGVGPFSPAWNLLRPDVDKPVLLLLAAQDSETPIKQCFPRLDEMKAQGKPVAWHVYSDATHAWDKGNPRRGYVKSISVTADAMRRTLDFLKAN
jgi:dienelactone hydrolase